MAIPLVAGLAGLGRIGAGIAARQAAKKTAEIGLRSASMARGVEPMTKGAAAVGAAGAASAGLSAMDGVRAGVNGDAVGVIAGGLGMIPGASMARNAGRAGISALGAASARGYAAGDAVNRTGVTNAVSSAVRGEPFHTQGWTGVESPDVPVETAPPQGPTTDATAEARRQADAAARIDSERTSNINGFGVRAGQNYQEITDDLRNMAKQGVREWQPRDSGMTEWEADNRRREIRMAYSNHPIPGKGESKVMQFDQDLQKRREAIENARVAGFNANAGAFDKALNALGQANGQSVDMADKMFGQTATRRGQDITREKNVVDGQVNMLSALGQLAGGGKSGGKSDSPYKEQKERLDYLKAVAETQYPDNPQGQKRFIDGILLNSENAKAWDTLMQNGMPNVANEALTSFTDGTTYSPEQLAGAERSRISLWSLRDQLKGQWDDLGDSKKDNTTWFEPRYRIPGSTGGSVNERTLASLRNQSVTELIKQAAMNPEQRVNGMPFTFADFGGDEAAFQRAVMSHFRASHQDARNAYLPSPVERDANGKALNPFR